MAQKMNMLRGAISILLGLLILFGAVRVAQRLMAMRSAPETINPRIITPVSVQTVKNGIIPLTITTSGNLMAKNRVDIFSEVSGVFETSDGIFKPGSYYQSGQVLLNINSDEHRTNIRAQKSTLFNQVVLFLPDLKLDYPASFPQWDEFVKNFDIEKPLSTLPDPQTEKEKLFVIGKGINTIYHNIENLEERLSKYVIRAPFSGVLTDALVQPGTLVRNGQKLGEFISTGIYELEINVNVGYLNLLKLGKRVVLHNLNRTSTWSGRVSRINGKVEQGTQTIKVFIDVSGRGLKEGMYLEADLEAQQVENSFEVDRKLLIDGENMFVVQDTVLKSVTVEPVFFKDRTVIVRGLSDGVNLLAQQIPGAHGGMRVEILNN